MSDPAVKETEVLALQPRQDHALMRPVASPGHLVEVHKEVTELITQALEKGRDYGVIPGTDRPTLLKPGAERLCIAFGAYPRYTILESEVDHGREVSWVKRKKKWRERQFDGWEEERGTSLGIYRYVVRCEIVRRDTGSIVGDAIGSASTLEAKYIDRPRDCENTVLKMAEKRAHVAATLNGFGLSDRFTQDIEPGSDEEQSGGGRAAKGAAARSGTRKPAASSKRDEGPAPDQVALIDEWIARDDLPEKLRGWLRTRLADKALTAELAAGIIEKTRRDYPATREQEAPPPADGEPPPMDDTDAPEPGSRG